LRPSLVPSYANFPAFAKVSAYGSVKVSAEAIPALRKNPGKPPKNDFPATTLKSSEEQTVAGVAAVFQAIERFKMQDVDYSAWGVVAAPIFFGRSGNASALRRYRDEGAWGIAPQMIPHWSIHALPGTISMVLKIHGPNYAISNGTEAFGEGVMLAATMLSEGRLPGLWLVLTRHNPEFIPNDDTNGTPANNVVCEAVAFALTPIDGDFKGPEFLFSPDEETTSSSLAPLDLSAMVDQLQTNNPRGRWRLPGHGWFGIEDRNVPALSAG